jgi:hypothetical protein
MGPEPEKINPLHLLSYLDQVEALFELNCVDLDREKSFITPEGIPARRLVTFVGKRAYRILRVHQKQFPFIRKTEELTELLSQHVIAMQALQMSTRCALQSSDLKRLSFRQRTHGLGKLNRLVSVVDALLHGHTEILSRALLKLEEVTEALGENLSVGKAFSASVAALLDVQQFWIVHRESWQKARGALQKGEGRLFY